MMGPSGLSFIDLLINVGADFEMGLTRDGEHPNEEGDVHVAYNGSDNDDDHGGHQGAQCLDHGGKLRSLEG